ncbi:MAG: DMT family transporter [Alphaproteobacteria bacterium]
MISLFLLVGLIGGTTWVLVPVQLKYLPFEFAVSYRFGLASLVLFTVALVKHRSFIKISRTDHLLLVLQGILFFGLNHILCYISSQYIPTGLIAVSVSLMIIPNAILGFLLFRESITPQYILGATLGLIGVLLTLYGKDFSLSGHYFTGFSIAFCSTFLSAAGTILSKKLTLRKIPILWITAYGTLYGSIFSFFLGFLHHGKIYTSFDTSYILALFYVSIVATAFVSIVYFQVVAKQGASRAAYLWLVVPVIAVFASQICENFHPHILTWFGLALVMGGLFLCLNEKKIPMKKLDVKVSESA